MVALERLELSTAGLGNLKSSDRTALHIVAQHCIKVRYKPTPQPTPKMPLFWFIQHRNDREIRQVQMLGRA
jgi:hypothetical protein